MQSNKSLAVWASQTYPQETGENNWSQYQLSLTGSSSKFNVNSSGSSSTTLSLYDAVNPYGNVLAAGDTMLLSTNGSSFTSGTLGTQTTTTATYGFTTVASGSFVSRTLTAGSGAPYFVHPDGTKMWWHSGASSIVYEYNITTPYDLGTATRTTRNFIHPNGNNRAFCFSPDGTTLYTVSTAAVISSYSLSTAWDITTIAAYPNGSCTITLPTNANWTTTSSFILSIRFSPDGTKMLIQNGNPTSSDSTKNNWALYTLNVPWVLGSLASGTTTNFTSYQADNTANTYSTLGAAEFSPDGRTLFTFAGIYGSPTCTTSTLSMETFTFATPWVLTSWSRAITYKGSWTTGSATQPWCVACFNQTGTQISVALASKYNNFACDYFTKYNYNIAGYSLGATPTNAYAAAPTVKVSAETTAARVNLFDYQTYMASSSTTQAVLYKPSAGYIAAGDTLSLNGSTTVTTSAVTEGSTNGVSAIPIYTAANRTYAGKTLTLMAGGARSIGNFVISPDGTTFVCGLIDGAYGAGIYAYNLSTPFDISTATFANSYIALTPDSAYFTSYANKSDVAFDISPDGKRLITLGCYVTGSETASSTQFVARDYILNRAWNLSTISYTNNKWQPGTTGTYTSGTTVPTGIRFTPDGSQVVACFNNAASTDDTSWVIYQSCGTPYRIGTAATGGVIWYTTSVNGVGTVIFTPDGLNITTFNRTNIATSNTLGTANSMATATQTNALGSATNRWSWPAGTISPTTTWPTGGCYSPDGTKLYITANASVSPTTVWQMNVMVIPQTSYTCTFPTQGSAPTSVIVPDRSVNQTITTTLSSGTMTFAASSVSTNARGIAMKITSPKPNTSITNATLSVWRS